MRSFNAVAFAASLGFKNEGGKLLMSAEELGTRLGFSEPRRSVLNILSRHTDELSSHTSVIKLMTEAGVRHTTHFDEHGCYIVAMLSKTEKAKHFRKQVAKLLSYFRECADRLSELDKTGASASGITTFPDVIGKYTALLEKYTALLEDQLETLRGEASPKEPPRRATSDELDAIRKLWGSGHNAASIAKKIGRECTFVIYHIGRMGLQSHVQEAT